MIGVLDRDTNEMTLRPASLINLKPYIKSFEIDGIDPTPAKELSYGEKHKKLAMKFGGNKIQKAIKGFLITKIVFAPTCVFIASFNVIYVANTQYRIHLVAKKLQNQGWIHRGVLRGGGMSTPQLGSRPKLGVLGVENRDRLS